MQAFMKSSLDYIEQNLKTDITVDELAKMAGYSIWHYYRLFGETTGSPVLGYILRRRLDHALAEISSGRKAIDVIFEYGFDTYAGFYKAFVKMYGVSPKKYLSIYGEHKLKKMGGNYYMMARKEFTEGELREILANWEIPQDLPLKKRSIRCMDGNTLTEREWKVGDEYVLTMEERSNMIQYLRKHKALASHGFIEVVPIKTKSGEESIDEANMFILTPKATGEPLIEPLIPLINKFELDDKHKRLMFCGSKYGEAIAKIHNALTMIEANVMPYEWNLYEYADSCISHLIKDNEQFKLGLPEEFFKDFTETFGALADKLPKQLVCGNAHPRNILFDKNGNSVGFEFLPGAGSSSCSERNFRLYDLCNCADEILGELTGWWNRTNTDDDIHDKWFEIFSGMLHGYNTINPLTAEEKQAVYYVICAIKISSAGRFGVKPEWEKSSEITGWRKTTYETLKYIVANKNKFDNILFSVPNKHDTW
jgi:AraC-like DNA-binding protein/Ser/Thr protein kinase RdoA (MazF antagonist)